MIVMKQKSRITGMTKMKWGDEITEMTKVTGITVMAGISKRQG